MGREPQPVQANYDSGTTFVSWTQLTYTFNASSEAELLTFEPTGSGSPPMSLLDGVSIASNTPPVPGPAEWALVATGLGLVMLRLCKRRQQSFI